MNSGNNATNDQRIHKCYVCRNNSDVLMLPLYGTVVTPISVSQTKKLLHMTQLKIQNDQVSSYIFSLFLHC